MPGREGFIISFVYNDVVSHILFTVLVVFVPDMSLTIGLCGESKVTYFALKRLLSRVSPHVLEQGALVPGGVGAGAHVALEGGHQQVLLVVTLQSSQVGKHRWTQATGKFSLQLHLLEHGIIVLLSVVGTK